MIEPRDLPTEAFDPLLRWWGKSNEVREKVRQTAEEVADVGVDVTLDPSATMMFDLASGHREPLADGETAGRAQDLSPGVLLRPLWQDACLPTIAFVVGPGELAYLCCVAPLYRLLGVPQPVFVPRASMTLVEPSMQRLLTRFSLDLPDLDQSPEKLAERLLQSSDGSDVEDALDGLKTRPARILDDIETAPRRTRRSMMAPRPRAHEGRPRRSSLQQKVRNSRQNREGTASSSCGGSAARLRPRSASRSVLGPLAYATMGAASPTC